MKRFVILGLVVVLVVAGWTGAWFWGAGMIDGYRRQLAAADGVATPRLDCASFSVGGYPFGYDLTCTGAILTSGDTTVEAAGLKATVEVSNPMHVLVFARSPVNIADAFTGSRSRVDFASAEASARLAGWRIGRISLVVESPIWNDTVLDDRLIAKAAHLEAHLVDLPDLHDANAGLAGLGQYVKLEGLEAPGFGIAAGTATLESDVDRLPDDVRTYADPDLLRRWQAAGGSFTLRNFTGADAVSSFEATGKLQLDAAGKLNGQVKLQSKGMVERLGPLIPEQYRGLVTGAPAADGSYTQTLTFAAGVVFSGIAPVAMIPPLF
jgi:hypothetical protein